MLLRRTIKVQNVPRSADFFHDNKRYLLCGNFDITSMSFCYCYPDNNYDYIPYDTDVIYPVPPREEVVEQSLF